MKKVLALVLALVLIFSLTACGSAKPEGSWKLTAMTQDGENALEDLDLNVLASKGLYFGMTFKDGKGTLNILGQEQSFTYDNKAITTKDEEGKDETIEYTLNGDTLTLSGNTEGSKQVMTFKKMTDDEASKFAAQKPEDVLSAMIEIAMEKLQEED